MVELSLLPMASAAFSSSPAVFAPSKELQSTIPIQGKRQDMSKGASVKLCTQRLEDQGQSVQMLSHYGQSYQPIALAKRPALVDVQDSRLDSVLFGFGIAEQCARQEKILKFLMSGSNGNGGLNTSPPYELMGYQTLAVDMDRQPYMHDDKFSLYEIGLDEPEQYLPEKQIFIPDPLLDFVGNLSQSSTLTIDQNGRVVFTGNGDEMRDLLAIISDFDPSKRGANSSKAALLVPYFGRKRRARANNQSSNPKLETMAVDPSKSPVNLKLKGSPKKKQLGKINREQPLSQKNYVLACEAFLTVILEKEKGGSTILSLRKTGPEITELLTQFSIGIAGTGLAVLFSVACKLASGGRAPLAASRLLSTGVGLGLFWLSWAVKGLQDTITSIFEKPRTAKVKADEAAAKIDRSMNVIRFRAVALAALTALKLAGAIIALL